MPDIFDTVEAQPKGDIFDEVSRPKDVFDSLDSPGALEQARLASVSAQPSLAKPDFRTIQRSPAQQARMDYLTKGRQEAASAQSMAEADQEFLGQMQSKVKAFSPYHAIQQGAETAAEQGIALGGEGAAGTAIGAGMLVLNTAGGVFAPVMAGTREIEQQVAAGASALGGDRQTAEQQMMGTVGLYPDLNEDNTWTKAAVKRMGGNPDSLSTEFISQIEFMAREDPGNAALMVAGLGEGGANLYAARLAKLGRPLPAGLERNLPETRATYDRVRAELEAKGKAPGADTGMAQILDDLKGKRITLDEANARAAKYGKKINRELVDAETGKPVEEPPIELPEKSPEDALIEKLEQPEQMLPEPMRPLEPSNLPAPDVEAGLATAIEPGGLDIRQMARERVPAEAPKPAEAPQPPAIAPERAVEAPAPKPPVETAPVAGKPVEPAMPSTPASVLHTAKNVKLKAPEGTSMVRVTDANGKVAEVPVGDLAKDSPLRGAGPFKSVEAGRMVKGKFEPIKGKVEAVDKDAPKVEQPKAEQPKSSDPLETRAQDLSKKLKESAKRKRKGVLGAADTDLADATELAAIRALQQARAARLSGVATQIKRDSQDAVRAMTNLAGVTKGAVKSGISKVADLGRAIRNLPSTGDFLRSIHEWDGKLQETSLKARQIQETMRAKVPDAVKREGILNYIEAGGNETILQARARGARPKYKAGYEAALKLTDQEKAIANGIKDFYETYLQKAQEVGLLEDGRQNYVNRIIKNPDALPPHAGSKLKAQASFAKRRSFATAFDAESAGYDLATKDVADLMAVYAQEFGKVVATRKLIADLTKGVAKDGRPLAAPTGMGTVVGDADTGRAILVNPNVKGADVSDFRPVHHAALSGWKWIAKDDAGNPVMIKGDMAIHPEVQKHLSNVLGHSAIKAWYDSPGSAWQALPKALVGGLDKFQTLSKQTMFGLISTFHYVTEGTHAIGHRVNPFAQPKIDLKVPWQREAVFNHGLKIAGDYNAMSAFREGVASGPIIYKVPIVGRISRAVSEFMFNEYIPRLKMATYKAIMDRNLKRYAPEIAKGEATREQVGILSAQQANAAYGHLNYVQMGRSPTIQHLTRMFALAPDFLEARARFAGQGLRTLAASKVGVEQLEALAVLGIVNYVAARILNKLGDDDYHWDKPFSVVFKNREFKPRTVPEDLYRAYKDAYSFAGGRVSPVLGRALLWLANGQRDYQGQKQPLYDMAWEAMMSWVPTALPVGPRRRTDINAWENMLASMTLSVSRYSPVTTAYKLADKYREEKGLPKDTGLYPLSKYRDLRYAIEDQDEKKFVEAYTKLVKQEGDFLAAEGKNRAGAEYAMAKGLRESLTRPFTGSAIGDAKWMRSLKEDERKVVQLAKERRMEIMRNFLKMRGQLLKANTTASAEWQSQEKPD